LDSAKSGPDRSTFHPFRVGSVRHTVPGVAPPAITFHPFGVRTHFGGAYTLRGAYARFAGTDPERVV